MMRAGPQAVTLNCPQCQQHYPAELTNIIDAGAAPELKARLLAGDLNLTQCPHCRAANPIVVPLLYHDGEKDFCVTHLPPQLNLNADQQEKIIGELLNGLIATLPAGSARGYLLQPRSSLTLENLREQIMIADGYSSEDIQAQREMSRLLGQLLSAPPERLDATIRQLDEQIDERFLGAITMLCEQMRRDGQQDTEAELRRLLDKLLTVSASGQRARAEQERQLAALQQTQADLEALGEQPGRQQIRQLALRYLDEDDLYLESLVGAIRPALDYVFYQELTTDIQRASGEDQARLARLRDRLLEISERVDRLRQLALQQADALLTELLSADDLPAAIQQRIPEIDSYFFEALATRLGAAEDAAQREQASKLRALHEQLMILLEAGMRPELRLLNDLLEMEDEDAAVIRLSAEGASLREALLTLMDELLPIIREQGEDRRLRRLEKLRAVAASLPENE